MPEFVSALFPNLPEKKEKKFERPTLEQVKAYCAERGRGVDPEHWFDHYSANGWRVGRNPMKDWKAAVRTWERNGFEHGNGNGSAPRVDCLPEDSPAFKIRKQQQEYLQRKAAR